MNSFVRRQVYKNLRFFGFLVIKYFRPQFQNPGNHQVIYDEKD